jgi:hypothetical protein
MLFVVIQQRSFVVIPQRSFVVIPQRSGGICICLTVVLHLSRTIVISTVAADGFIVRRAVEKPAPERSRTGPPHFAFLMKASEDCTQF